MTARSFAQTRLGARRWLPVVLAAFCLADVGAATLFAQPDSSTGESLRRRIEERFNVLLTPDAVSLRPVSPIPDVRWVELVGDTITIDGDAVTGAELRDRLGADAELVIRLSYLDAAARQSLLESPRTPIAAPAPAQPSVPDRSRRRTDSRVRIGGSVTVDADEIITGDVVAIGGSARVDGEVRGQVVAVGGDVELGPNAVVTGDTVVVGGTLHRDPAAELRGDVQEIGLGMIDFDEWSPRVFGPWLDAGMSSMFRLISTLVRVGVLCLLVGLVMLVAHEQVARVGRRAAVEPVKSGIVGILSQLLFVPLLVVTVIVLIITIIGIPLLLLIPFVILGFAIVGLLGFSSVAHYVGGLVNVRFGWSERGQVATALLGVLVIVSPLLLSRFAALAGGFVFPITFSLSFIGTVVEYLAWTVGFGAVALARLSPTPLPPAVSQGTT